MKTNQLKPIASAKDHKFRISGVRMNDARLPTPYLRSCPPNFSSTRHPTPFPPRKTFVFRDWQWGICHYTHYDIFYICSKKLGLNYTGELLKTALNAIIIYCISNSLQQLITLLNLVFFSIPPSLKLILSAMNKQSQLHWVPILKESLDSRKEFDWQLWDQGSLSSGKQVSHLESAPLLQSASRFFRITGLSMLVPAMQCPLPFLSSKVFSAMAAAHLPALPPTALPLHPACSHLQDLHFL